MKTNTAGFMFSLRHLGLAAILASLAYQHTMAMAPPIREEFNEANSPVGPLWFDDSSPEGRVELRGDTESVITNSMPGTLALFSDWTGGSRVRGNFFRCDTTTELTRQGFFLGRSVSQPVQFVVYESSTENGTYNLIASNTVTATVGTNLVYSTALNAVLEEGRYYMIGMAWSNTSGYRTAGAHPRPVYFGESLNGFEQNVTYPANTTITKGSSNYLYVQTLEVATNMVMRMDDTISGGLTSTNSLSMVVDVEGYDPLTLSFRHRSSGEEAHTEEGIFLSNDSGSTFQKIYDLPNGTTGWQTFNLDVNALAASNGIPIIGTPVIKFQQVDNYPWPTDGREFDDIQLYSIEDIEMHDADYLFASNASNIWKKVIGTRNIPIELDTYLGGGTSPASYPNTPFRFTIMDGGTPVYSNTVLRNINFQALEYLEDDWTANFEIPGTTHFAKNLYTIEIEADPNDLINEGNEINNTVSLPISINQYSGKLFFDDVETQINVTDWSRTSDTQHTISGSGSIAGYNFVFNDLDVVKDLVTQDYTIDPLETQKIVLSISDKFLHAGIQYTLTNGPVLNRNGVLADVNLRLPAGLGMSTANDYVMESTFAFSNVSLDDALLPKSVLTETGPFKITEETKPMWLDVADISWDAQNGTIDFSSAGTVKFTRGDDHNILKNSEPLLEYPELGIKRSNAEYYLGAATLDSDVSVTAGASQDARMTATVTLNPEYFYTHFPYGPIVEWNTVSSLSIVEDLVETTSELIDTQDMSIEYSPTLPKHACGANSGLTFVPMKVGQAATFSKDGGLLQTVEMNNLDIRWGESSSGNFAQEALDFQEGQFYMAGHFIRGDQNNYPANYQLGPAVVLLSGAITKSSDMERPGYQSGVEDYRVGLANYAGLNVLTGTDAAFKATSVLGGTPSGDWLLTERAKYYLRPSGVTGIQEASPGTFPETLFIYGYRHNFEQYGFSYLSGIPKESRTSGLINIFYPSNFDLEFEEMEIDFMGEIEGADIAGAPEKTLEYWNAVIDPLSLFYAPMAGNSCGNSERGLCLGVTTSCANIDKPLAGVLGFMPSGEIASEAEGIVGVDSRLSLPDHIALDGPQDEVYAFTPILSAYYNDYGAASPAPDDTGWINFAGALDVAFFTDLNVLFHTSASTNNSAAPIYMTGGFTDSSGNTFHEQPEQFDEENAGLPSGVSVADFRNPSTDTHRARAQRTWLEVVDFDYPLAWSSATKSFKSPEAITGDIVILQVEHQTDYLSAYNAELSFGIQYDGLPQINLANMAFNIIDEQTGMASAVLSSVNSNIFQTIFQGLDRFDDLLADIPEELFEPILVENVDPIIDDLYDELLIAYSNAPNSDYYSGFISNYVAGPVASIQVELENLADTAANATNVLDEIDGHLEQAIRVIDAFTGTVEIDPLTGELLPQAVEGLLDLEGTEFEVLGDLAAGIVGTLATEIANSLASELEPSLNDVLSHLQPSLDTAREYLLEVQGVLEEVRTQLVAGESFARELQDALDVAELQAAMDAAADDLIDQFTVLQDAGDLLEEYTADEIKAIIRQSIEDQFYGSLPVCNIQQAIRARVYEVQASVNTAIDGVFQQVNTAIKDVIGEYLTAIDEEINGMLGDVSDVIGAGQIDGYAHIRHDSLTELRLDGAFQWKVPEEMEFNAYLIVRQLNSDGAAGCGLPGVNATEVILGSDDVDLSWVGSDLRAKINTKFAFGTGPFRPIGLAGAFEMTEGSINFEAFEMTELYAAVAFGLLENYLSAAIRCELTSFEVEGGVFFGRTCSLDPFAWDPDVQGILGDPPFTGVYVYGEGWMPIIDYGCLFRIKAGVGAGMFAFLEGPIGGKVFLGAEGEAICVVGVRGEVTLVGMKNGDIMRMKGKGKISGKVGPCPFCVKFSKSAEITYENGDWDADY